MRTHLIYGLLLVTTCSFIIAACSQAPYPTTYGLTSQKMMQAAGHWQILAEDTANKISEKVSPGSKLYLSKNSDEPFYAYFADFLEQELVNKNYVLCESRSADCLPVLINARVLQHGERILDVYPGLIPVVTGTVVSSLAVAGGVSTGGLPQNEVLVSIRIVKEGKTVLAENNVYYVGEDEVWHYDKYPDAAETGIPSKTMQIVGE